MDYNLKTGDSTKYKIEWNKDCQYTLTYTSSGEKRTAAEREMLSKYKQAYEILSVSPNYYVHNIYLGQVHSNNRGFLQISTDTAWLKSIAVPGNRVLYEPLKEKASHLKRHFNDTSSYAILYLYRPHKIWGMKDWCYVYFGQDFVYPAMDGTKIAYKVFKEGALEIHAGMSNVARSVPLDIKFGKKYYIECLLENSPPKTKAVLLSKDEAKGQVDFDSM